MWSEKYRPVTMEEMVGNAEARAKFQNWLRKWKPGSRAAMLVGPPGTGKTTTVHLVAKTMGLQLIELNASDSRTKEKLSKRVGEALSTTSLFGGGTIIFLDEVDGLAGRSDYGAVEFIRDAVKKSRSPVVMAANNQEAEEVRKLSSATTRIEFRRPEVGEVETRLREIARQERMPAGEDMIPRVSRAANGDLRAAINFLQSGIPAQKDEEHTASESIDSFFGAQDAKSALKALRGYPGQPRDKIRDLFTAVTRSRVHEERKAEALDVLSRADVIMGRIMRGRDWRLLRYLDPMIASELWRALGDGGPRYTLDAVPWPLQVRIWNDSKKLKEVAGLVGKGTWSSRRSSLVADIPYLVLLCSQKGFRDELVRTLDLEENYDLFLAKEAWRFARR